MADALVSSWLAELGLSNLIPMLASQGIDAEAMAALSDAHFAALGISRIGDKAKLRSALFVTMARMNVFVACPAFECTCVLMC